MRKNLLGRTGLEISELALGGGDTGGILIRTDEVTRIAALNRAVEAGINWIDTAAAYGEGESEETLGRYLHTLSPRPYVSTKVRLVRDDLDDIPSAIARSLDASLSRLQTDSVALFQLHNQLGESVGDRLALSVEQVLGRGGVADTFDRLKDQGLCWATGISALGDTGTCLEVINSGRFDCAQVYYNAINPSAGWSHAPPSWRAQDFGGIIGACFLQNMGILNIRVYAGGPLATAMRPRRLSVLTFGTDLDNEVRCADAIRKALGEEFGSSAQMALRFVLGNRDISSRVVGLAELAFLEEALNALESGPLPSAAVAKLKVQWATDFT